MMTMAELLKKTIDMEGSDLHISTGNPPIMRIHGELHMDGEIPLTDEDTYQLINQIANDQQLGILGDKGEVDFSFAEDELGRFRVNAYKQMGYYNACIRVISLDVPDIQTLGLPPIIKDFAMKKRGMILVTGPTGSGKSTTLAAMIDYINTHKSSHILTLEDPIEYIHKTKKSMINQREIGFDSHSYANALRAALRQDPDVILVGEMRDLDTIRIALTAAETGHMVISTLHTIGAVKTIDRIIDVFPPHQQQQIRIQLSSVLEAIVSQQLMPNMDHKGRVAAFEIMTNTSAISHLIREGKNHQIKSNVQTGLTSGMCSMDYSIGELYQDGSITKETAYEYAVDKEMITRYIR